MPIDLNNLKEQVQSILEAANTTTADTDLSGGLVTRVQRVLKVNPGRIPVQSTFYPFVTVYIEKKETEIQTFAVNQVNPFNHATISLKVIGAVWNSSITDEELDPADEECEDLMENIEAALRRKPTLNDLVQFSFPSLVTYHNVSLDEGVHVRYGVITLEATAFEQG
jgi:hypothetical protein